MDARDENDYKRRYLKAEIAATEAILTKLRARLSTTMGSFEEVYMNSLTNYEIKRRQCWLDFLTERLAELGELSNE